MMKNEIIPILYEMRKSWEEAILVNNGYKTPLTQFGFCHYLFCSYNLQIAKEVLNELKIDFVKDFVRDGSGFWYEIQFFTGFKSLQFRLDHINKTIARLDI